MAYRVRRENFRRTEFVLYIVYTRVQACARLLYMDVQASAEFRKTYSKLTEPTEVRANGRLVGTWYPAGTGPSPAPAIKPIGEIVMKERDTFGASRPAPKPGGKK